MNILNEKGVRTQLISGVKYVYIDTPYWDKAKKQNRHKREYIGKLDESGSFVPNKNYLSRQNLVETGDRTSKQSSPSPFAERKFFGATHLLDCIGEQTGLTHDLDAVFGKAISRKIQSLAYFLVLESESSMYRFGKFAKTHRHPYAKDIASQRISELFAGITEDEKYSFFRHRAARCLQEEYLAYDTTSISSYSEMMKSVKYGKNKDLENLPQINLAIVFGEKSMQPIYYRKLPGNINDVSTVGKLLVDMDFIGVKKAKFIFDRGFYSKRNIDALFRKNHKFVVAGKSNTLISKDLLNEVRESIKHFSNYNEEQQIYAVAKKSVWEYEYTDRRGNTHSKSKPINLFAYYDGQRAEREKTEFIIKLKEAESAFLNDCMTQSQQDLLDKYFYSEKTPTGRVPTKPNNEAIESRMGEFGFFTLLSNHITDAIQALQIYRSKDVAEKAFSNIKNRLDMKRTGVSSEEALEGKLFLQFVALTYVSYINQVMAHNDLYKNYTMSTLLDELDVIELYTYPNKKVHISEVTKKQSDILSCFNVSIDYTL